MGCDIHIYAEKRSPRSCNPSWHQLNIGPDDYLPRDYEVFGAIAGVRRDDLLHFEPRGIPSDVCLNIADKYFDLVKRGDKVVFITEDGELEEFDYEDYKDCEQRSYGEVVNIASPDWHSASWLYTKELEQALEVAENANCLGISIDYKVLLKVMKEYESSGEYECRVVFWFDN